VLRAFRPTCVDLRPLRLETFMAFERVSKQLWGEPALRPAHPGSGDNNVRLTYTWKETFSCPHPWQIFRPPLPISSPERVNESETAGFGI
jgi:hypothetical protein